MQITIDQDKCIGCGTCVGLVPNVFQINDEMKAEVVNPEGDTIENIKKAEQACPVQAIEVK